LCDDGAVESNYGVDFVLLYKVPPEERDEVEAGFTQLVKALTGVGLATEVRHGDNHSLLIFVKIASTDLLAQQVYRARLQDWLHGVRTSSPDKDIKQSLDNEPITEAERLRLVYLMITGSADEGGAGIVPGADKWKYLDSVFPLHNHAFNKAWIQKWSKKYILDQDDLDEIRNKFGESVAFYFAFVQAYFKFQVFPSAAGFAAWMLLGQFSVTYALASCLWSVVFFEYWRQREVDLAVQWGTRGVSSIQHQRPEFKWEFEAEDAVTGEPVKVYSPYKRAQTQLLQIPFALACIAVLGSLVATCNSLEIFINEVYNGPFKQYLGFLPTILLVIGTPTCSAVLMKAAQSLTDLENYETVDAHQAALIQKQFVLNFMTSYMPLLFTAFVYIPFGNTLVPLLEFWHQTAQTIAMSEKPLPTREFTVNPARISSQMFYFTVTAQIVNFATEVVVPYVKRKVMTKAKEFTTNGKEQHAQDHPEEKDFLQRVREECELETYDVSGDYREMVMQYGYLSLFSVAWPLAGLCFWINNWFELRSDAVKIAISSRRPIPWREDSIGPWLTALGFLSWLGSITSAAIVYLCTGSGDGARGTTSHIAAWGLLLSIFLSENFYIAIQMGVRYVMGKVESPGLQRERRERYMTKKQMLEENIGQSMEKKAAVPSAPKNEAITREALEEEARQGSLRGHDSAEEMFWQRQRGEKDTVQVGRYMIQEQIDAATKNSSKAAQAMPSQKAS